jgi:hypothetical protein
MRADEKAAKTGRVSPAAQRAGGRSELAGLRATCRRQAYVIDALDRVVVHDRYRRTRDAPTWIVGLRARAIRTRSRALDAVGEQARRPPRASCPRPR